MPPHAPKATTDQLRDDIDRGRTGDKVHFPDPAAAPLGTDDEAAGCAPHPDTVDQVRQHERAKADRMRGDPPDVQLRTWLILAATIGILGILLWAALSYG